MHRLEHTPAAQQSADWNAHRLCASAVWDGVLAIIYISTGEPLMSQLWMISPSFQDVLSPKEFILEVKKGVLPLVTAPCEILLTSSYASHGT